MDAAWLSDGSDDEEWALVALYVALCRENALRRD